MCRRTSIAHCVLQRGAARLHTAPSRCSITRPPGPSNLSGCQPTSVRRPIEHIAPEELALAILYLVENQFGLFEESLPQTVARLLGIERLRSEDADTIRAVAEDLVRKGKLRRAGAQVHLA